MAALNNNRSFASSWASISILCGVYVILSLHVTNAKETSEEFGHSNASNTGISAPQLRKSVKVYPAYGLTTGPPTPASEEQQTSRFMETAQAYHPKDAQEFKRQSEETLDIAINSNTGRQETGILEVLEGVRSQRFQENASEVKSMPLKGQCALNAFADDQNHPDEDTVPLYEALKNILEHVTGVDNSINDPEEIRIRAYLGERSSYGVQLILQDDNTQFVEDAAHRGGGGRGGGEEAFEAIEAVGDPTHFHAPNFTLSQQHYVEEEAIDEQDTRIIVQEGSRLRLVCNVTGVPTYFVEWRRAANLSFPGGASVVGGRSVLLDYVGREDAGVYSCTATTPSGHSHSSALGIRVHYVPIVGVWARDMDSGMVELGCLVEGSPRPSAAWYINNTKISPSNCRSNVEIRSSVLSNRFVLSVLTLTNLTVDDYAYYHCRATNPIGDARAYVMLHDDSAVLDLGALADTRPVKHPAAYENPRLSSFMLGMVPPLYIGIYIIAYLGCYKTSISGVGAHGRFGVGVDLNE